MPADTQGYTIGGAHLFTLHSRAMDPSSPLVLHGEGL